MIKCSNGISAFLTTQSRGAEGVKECHLTIKFEENATRFTIGMNFIFVDFIDV